MFVYIIAYPLDFLGTMFSGSELTQVTQLHDQFSLDQNIDINDTSYQASKGVDYSGIKFLIGSTNVIYFNQADERLADKPYGQTGTIGTSGCGSTSLAMVVSSLSGKTIDLVQMSNWAYENGYRYEGSCSYHSLIPNGARHFGLVVEGCTV